MGQQNPPGGIDHEVPTQAQQIGFLSVVAAAHDQLPFRRAQQSLQVEQTGPQRPDLSLARLGDPMAAVDLTLGIRDEEPGAREVRAKAQHQARRLEGDDHNATTRPDALRLLQLQQMLSSGESEKVAKEDQQGLLRLGSLARGNALRGERHHTAVNTRALPGWSEIARTQLRPLCSARYHPFLPWSFPTQ